MSAAVPCSPPSVLPPGQSVARRPARQAGFTLIEVLIALLVVAIGALAIGRFSSMLVRHAEAARHRTEAAMLAQAKLDELRGFAQVLPGAGASYADMTGGDDQPEAQSNTRFERRWEVGGTASDPHRRIDVQVDWTDRDGIADPAGVRLTALVSRAEPGDTARAGLPPADPLSAARPLGRSVAIPWPAVRLAGANRGRSALRWAGPSGGYLLFDERTGRITDQCAAGPDDTTDITASCRPIDALLLAGYLSGPGAATAIDVSIVQTQHVVALPECHVEDAVPAGSSGDAASGAGGALIGLRAYRCIVRPADHDGDAGTARAWSGRAIVLPQPTGTQTVCRYTRDPPAEAEPPRNDDHPAVYTLVTRNLQQQNFALITAGACPEGSVRHQPE